MEYALSETELVAIVASSYRLYRKSPANCK